MLKTALLIQTQHPFSSELHVWIHDNVSSFSKQSSTWRCWLLSALNHTELFPLSSVFFPSQQFSHFIHRFLQARQTWVCGVLFHIHVFCSTHRLFSILASDCCVCLSHSNACTDFSVELPNDIAKDVSGWYLLIFWQHRCNFTRRACTLIVLLPKLHYVRWISSCFFCNCWQ